MANRQCRPASVSFRRAEPTDDAAKVAAAIARELEGVDRVAASYEIERVMQALKQVREPPGRARRADF
jgi:hypothetical protein